MNRTRQRSRQSSAQQGGINNVQQRQGGRVANTRLQQTEDSLMLRESDGYFVSEKQEDPTQQIFGHNIFTNPNLTFEPNVNVATPADYRLGPGDEVMFGGLLKRQSDRLFPRKEVFKSIHWDLCT